MVDEIISKIQSDHSPSIGLHDFFWSNNVVKKNFSVFVRVLICLNISPSVRQSVSPSVRQSVSPSVCWSVSPSVPPSVSPTIGIWNPFLNRPRVLGLFFSVRVMLILNLIYYNYFGLNFDGYNTNLLVHSAV